MSASIHLPPPLLLFSLPPAALPLVLPIQVASGCVIDQAAGLEVPVPEFDEPDRTVTLQSTVVAFA
jgi:hypothetical protein